MKILRVVLLSAVCLSLFTTKDYISAQGTSVEINKANVVSAVEQPKQKYFKEIVAYPRSTYPTSSSIPRTSYFVDSGYAGTLTLTALSPYTQANREWWSAIYEGSLTLQE